MGRINWGRHRDTWKKKEENTEFMGELLQRKEGGVEGKQSIPIYKVGSLAS